MFKLDQILMRISIGLAIYFAGELLNAAYERVINPIFMDNPELAGLMSTANSLKSAYSRSRLAHVPRLPVNAVDMQIHEEYRSIYSAEGDIPFLLIDFTFADAANGVIDGRVHEYVLLVWYAYLAIAGSLLLQPFSVCPATFYQYFTINTFLGTSRRLIPLMHCLLSGKTQNIYSRLFAKIKEKAHELNIAICWETSMSDFETGLLPALSAEFPPRFIRRGCLFHFTNAVFRWIQERLMVSITICIEYSILMFHHQLLSSKNRRCHTKMKQQGYVGSSESSIFLRS